MKVSLNTVRALSNAVVDDDIDELVRKIGAQLGAVEEVVDYRPRYAGIVVAKVVSCIKHPNADKLSVCMIDDGGITPDVKRDDQGYVQVVCGAPNVREGLTVAWIPPGATVPTTFDNDPFVLEARELRGVVSNGMLASANELGISNDHSGLLEIEAHDVGEDLAKTGTAFGKLYGLDDVIIEIENKMFTHRPDCFGVLGVAREIAGIYGKQFTSPEWYLDIQNSTENQGVSSEALKLEVENQLLQVVPRFTVCAMNGIKIKPSPLWMQALLTRVGIKPINNVVDLTNYYSYVTAQPLHAYDYDKVASLTDGEGAKLIVRYPHEGEKVALLNGKTIAPRSEAIMIATDKELIGVGGVMGGTTTEVDENTKAIILECANFDMYSIRKTSMAHGLFTDAVTRFNKGQSALQNRVIINQVIRDTVKYAEGTLAGEVLDYVDCDKINISGDGWNDEEVAVSSSFINERLGLGLSIDDIKQTLKNVEFGFDDAGEKDIKVYSPFWRTDIALPEDIVEEVGRLIGFDKLPHELPARTMSPAVIHNELLLKKSLRSSLSSMGANEVLTYSFIQGDIMSKVGQDPSLAYKLSNALSPELQYYRMSLTPNLLTLVHSNIKSGNDRFTLFEMGKVHIKSDIDDGGLPIEFPSLGAVFTDKSQRGAAYYSVRAYIDELLDGSFALEKPENVDVSQNDRLRQLIAPYEPSRSAAILLHGEVIGVVGEFTQKVVRAFKLPPATAGFEILLSALSQVTTNSYVPLSKYPGISQDVCLEVARKVTFAELDGALSEIMNNSDLDDDITLSKRLIDIFEPAEAEVKRYTFRIHFVSQSRTLQEKLVSQRMDQIVTSLGQKINIRRI